MHTSKIRVAIVNYKPLHLVSDGEEKAVETIINATNMSRLNLSIKLFVLDSCVDNNKISKLYLQQIIPSSKYLETGLSAKRIMDFMSLIFFGYKYYSEKLNRNLDLFETMSAYQPDIIITVTSNLHGFIKKFKTSHPNVKIVSYMDSPKLISDSLSGLNAINTPKLMTRFLALLIKRRYISYYKRNYFDIALNSDAIVLASEQDKHELSSFLGKELHKKMFAIPPVIASPNKSIKVKNHKTSSVLFIGSSNYFPNQEAISLIKNSFAPKLPNTTFILAGNGLKTLTENNIKSIGNVKDLDDLIENADICIAPLLHGSGIKQKVLSYLSHGKPVVGTSIAFNGFDAINGSNAIVEDDIEKFPFLISHLQKNTRLFKKLQKNSKRLANQFSIDIISEKWDNLLSSVLRELF